MPSKKKKRSRKTRASDRHQTSGPSAAHTAPPDDEAPPPAADKARRPKKRRGAGDGQPVTAETLAGKQREISVSEFFAKNRHLLGFDNPRKALLTTVKEAVDNSLDACEEAGILPEIAVTIEHLPQIGEGRYRITIEDNGPGVVRRQIDNIFGKLLFGSKFHRLKMSRGQQGIGISAAGMYGLMTTGRPMVIVTRPKKGRPAHHVELAMDTTKNRPEVSVDVETDDFPDHTGTRVTIELEARYTRGRTSVDEYLEQTAIANPHARFVYRPPSTKPAADEDDSQHTLHPGEAAPSGPAAPEIPHADALDRTTQVGDVIVFPRGVKELPPEPIEIKPHPQGVELGTLMRMFKQTEHSNLGGFLEGEFSRVSNAKAQEIATAANLTPRTRVSGLGHKEAEALYKAIQATRLQSPPLNCLAPIGPRQILAGLLKGVRAEFYTASTRPPAVYRGNPFQIEVGVAFGGELPADQPARVIRFANRVPLLYQQSACASFKAVLETTWRNYGLSQSRGAVPEAPLVVMIHMASVWVPFTSESKEAIADYDEIRKEMRLALQECGRKLATYLRRRQRIRREGARRDIFERYIPEVVRALTAIKPDLNADRLAKDLQNVARTRTEVADEEFDEEGRRIARREASEPADEHTVIIESAAAPTGEDDDDAPAAPSSAPTDTDPADSPDRPRRKKKKKKKRRLAPPTAESGDEAQDSLF